MLCSLAGGDLLAGEGGDEELVVLGLLPDGGRGLGVVLLDHHAVCSWGLNIE